MNVYQILGFTLLVTLSLFLVVWVMIKYTRNFFTRHKYIRLEQFNKDKSISIKYIKREKFNNDDLHLLASDRIFNLKGYTTIILVEGVNENINPLDFNAKFDGSLYQVAIKTKLISETFATLKSNKFDDIKILLLISALTLVAVAFLIVKYMGLL